MYQLEEDGQMETIDPSKLTLASNKHLSYWFWTKISLLFSVGAHAQSPRRQPH
jgi:hypothetical protein